MARRTHVLSLVLGLVTAASSLAAQPGTPAQSPKISGSKALKAQAKVREDAAIATALGAVPNGKIQAGELEKENGKFVYSFDIKVPGKSGIEEVQVDALTGAIVSNVHETPADEKKEAAADAAAKKAKKP